MNKWQHTVTVCCNQQAASKYTLELEKFEGLIGENKRNNVFSNTMTYTNMLIAFVQKS